MGENKLGRLKNICGGWIKSGWSRCSGHVVKSQTMLKDMLKKTIFT